MERIEDRKITNARRAGAGFMVLFIFSALLFASMCAIAVRLGDGYDGLGVFGLIVSMALFIVGGIVSLVAAFAPWGTKE